MSKTQKIITSVGLVLACAVVYKVAHKKLERLNAVIVQPADSTTLVKDNSKTAVTTLQPAAASPAPVPQQAAPPIAENDTQAGPGPHGNDITPPDHPQALAPVGQFLSARNDAVDPSRRDPAMEFRNMPKTSTGNPLLDPPNEENTAGPVVSQESR